MKQNVALIGLSGTLKTTVARVLAESLNKRYVDTDELIVFEYGMPIKEIFEKTGEEYFRKIETKTIYSVAEFSDVVIATGGGAVLNENNMLALKETCIVVCLTASKKVLYERLKNDDTRPLLCPVTHSKVSDYVDGRKGLYEKWADFTVSTSNKTAVQVAQGIIKKLNKVNNNK